MSLKMKEKNKKQLLLFGYSMESRQNSDSFAQLILHTYRSGAIHKMLCMGPASASHHPLATRPRYRVSDLGSLDSLAE